VRSWAWTGLADKAKWTNAAIPWRITVKARAALGFRNKKAIPTHSNSGLKGKAALVEFPLRAYIALQ
jgi:hypothetical protein